MKIILLFLFLLIFKISTAQDTIIPKFDTNGYSLFSHLIQGVWLNTKDTNNSLIFTQDSLYLKTEGNKKYTLDTIMNRFIWSFSWDKEPALVSYNLGYLLKHKLLYIEFDGGIVGKFENEGCDCNTMKILCLNPGYLRVRLEDRKKMTFKKK